MYKYKQMTMIYYIFGTLYIHSCVFILLPISFKYISIYAINSKDEREKDHCLLAHSPKGRTAAAAEIRSLVFHPGFPHEWQRPKYLHHLLQHAQGC